MVRVRANRKRKNQQNTLNAALANSLVNGGAAFTPGVPSITMTLPELVGTFDIASSTCAGVVGLTAGLLTNFATRFVGFDEYRILRFVFQITPTCPSGGTAAAYVDPAGSGVPTATTAQTNVATFFNLNSAACSKPYILRYEPRDPALNIFQPITTTTFNYGYFKIYTDAANFANQNVTATRAFQVRAIITIQFRGLA
jgi:hypothetical protein